MNFLQCNSDQLRHTHVIDNRTKSREDFGCQERIKQIMDLTRRSEDEVIMALHDSDGDPNRAVNDLLEGISPEWEVKKKKARQSGGPKQSSEQSVVSDNDANNDNTHHTHHDRFNRGSVNYRSRGCKSIIITVALMNSILINELRETSELNHPKTYIFVVVALLNF